jgi:uncharacterized protein
MDLKKHSIGYTKTYQHMENREDKLFTVITGASSGIGKALAEECAGRKMNLYLIDLPGTGLPSFSKEMSLNHQISVEFLEIDLSGVNAHQEVFNFSSSKNLHINTLINNVGIGHNGNLETLSEEKVTEMLLLNARITTLLIRLYIPELKKQEQAYILNMCSMGAFLPLPGKSVYSASKAYVLFLTRAVQYELRATGISVSAAFPAGVPTNDTVKERIQNSGTIARSLVKTAGYVARQAIKGMLRKQEIIFPGNRIKAFFFLFSALPQGIALKLMYREFLKAPR